MFSGTQPRHRLNRRTHNESDIAVVGSSILDFSTLLPSDAQIATFNNPSTGNTPVLSTMDFDEDAYSPPMSASLLPHQYISNKPANLTAWFDSLFSDAQPMGRLNGEDFACWKEDLQGFSHEEYCTVLLHAAARIQEAETKLKDVNSAYHKDPFNSYLKILRASLDDSLMVGIPPDHIPWDTVTKERVQHMSTMAVKSGILQACKALHSVDSKIYDLNAKIEQRKSAMERQVETQKVRHTADNALIARNEMHPADCPRTRHHQTALSSTFPTQGYPYESAADPRYVPGLSFEERKRILMEEMLRSAYDKFAARLESFPNLSPDVRNRILEGMKSKLGLMPHSAQQQSYDRDFDPGLPHHERKRILEEEMRRFTPRLQAATQHSYDRGPKRKRGEMEAAEDRDYSLPADRKEALARLHSLEGQKKIKTADNNYIFSLPVDEREPFFAVRRAERFELQRLMNFVKPSVSSTRDGLEEGNVYTGEDGALAD